jgi:hypothetical protein
VPYFPRFAILNKRPINGVTFIYIEIIIIIIIIAIIDLFIILISFVEELAALLKIRFYLLKCFVYFVRYGGPCSIPGNTRKKVRGLERGLLSLVSTIEELLDRKVVAPV